MDVVAEIKARLSIVDVLSGRVELKKAGRNFKACCPFHQEKTPSFIISTERQFAWCYGCQTGGDIFKIVQLLEGIEFKEALKLLAEQAGVELPRGMSGENKEKKDRLLEINGKTAELFVVELGKNKKALDYLVERGLKQETITEWQIGYAPDSFDWLNKKLLEDSYLVRELAEAGVVGLKELAGEELYDRFRGRVMFPICDSRSRVVAFTGRILDSGEPKYLNSPESPIFTKGAILFGLNKARDAIRKEKQVIIVEGQMDVIMCHQIGFTNVVASSGTALTETHLQMLKKITDKVIFAFDSDQAGIDSTRRALELAIRLDLTAEVINLNGFKDPDEAIQKDPQIFTEATNNTLTQFNFYFQIVYHEADLSNISVKKKVAREMLAFAKNFASALEREDFVHQLALKLQVSEASLGEELKNINIFMPVQKEEPVESDRSDFFSREDILIGILLAFPDLARDVRAELQSLTLMHQPGSQIITELVNSEFDVKAALGNLPPEAAECAEKLNLYVSDKYADFSSTVIEKELKFLLAGLQKDLVEKKKRELLSRIHAAEEAGETEKAGELLQEYQTLLR